MEVWNIRSRASDGNQVKSSQMIFTMYNFKNTKILPERKFLQLLWHKEITAGVNHCREPHRELYGYK